MGVADRIDGDPGPLRRAELPASFLCAEKIR